ncbi:MAG: hypothetical protein C0508_24400, partial [Cyanobacteria bacterium PR.023]|nr:hypothetical protein [Cyanobacteria bacterium PR.023]
MSHIASKDQFDTGRGTVLLSLALVLFLSSHNLQPASALDKVPSNQVQPLSQVQAQPKKLASTSAAASNDDSALPLRLMRLGTNLS